MQQTVSDRNETSYVCRNVLAGHVQVFLIFLNMLDNVAGWGQGKTYHWTI